VRAGPDSTWSAQSHHDRIRGPWPRTGHRPGARRSTPSVRRFLTVGDA